MPFNIAIVGAGIAGLSTAIALSKEGHTVNVYERRANTKEQSGSGVQIQPTGVQILKKWGLLDDLAKISHESGSVKFFRYDTGKLIGTQVRKGERAQWYCLRNTFREFLYHAALAAGAKVHFGKKAVSVKLELPSVTFEDGTIISADVLIGADGTNSAIRQAMHPGSSRMVRSDLVIQAIVPKEVMYQDELTRKLYDDPALQMWCGPGTSAVTSSAPHQEIFDLQMLRIDWTDEQDPNPKKLLEPLQNYDLIKDRLTNWHPSFVRMLGKAKSYIKWRVVEAPYLPTAVSPNGRVILVGDSYHGTTPYAGEGSSLGIEDAAVITALIAKASSVDEIGGYLKVYDRIRLNRVKAIREYSDFLGFAFSCPDGEIQQKRDKTLAVFDPSNFLDAKPKIDARWGSAEWFAWLDTYDVDRVVRDALEPNFDKPFAEKSLL